MRRVGLLPEYGVLPNPGAQGAGVEVEEKRGPPVFESAWSGAVRACYPIPTTQNRREALVGPPGGFVPCC